MTSRHNIVKMQHDVDWNEFETHPEIDYVFIHYLVTFIMLKCFLIRKLFILILIGLYTLLLFPINLNGLICILFLVIIFIVDLYFNFMGVCDNWISLLRYIIFFFWESDLYLNWSRLFRSKWHWFYREI